MTNIKANELRLGNWISKDGEIYQATGYTILGVEREDFEVNPIPLTEEWFLRFGLEKAHDGYTNVHLEARNGVVRWIDTLKGFYLEAIDFPTMRFGVDFVHQLQNSIFSLTNQELTKEK